MVTFDEKNRLRKHKTVDEVLDSFCKVRFEYYTKRKRYQVGALEAELRYLGNKERFIREVIAEELLVMNRPEADILQDLKDRGYDEDPKKEDGEGGYDYLLRMQVRTFTADKVKQLEKDIASSKKELKAIQGESEASMWLRDIAEFEAAYLEWVETMNKI